MVDCILHWVYIFIMAVQFYNGKVLFGDSNGLNTDKVAMDPACCCDQPCYVIRPCDSAYLEDPQTGCNECTDKYWPTDLYVTLTGFTGNLPGSTVTDGTYQVSFDGPGCRWERVDLSRNLYISVSRLSLSGVYQWVVIVWATDGSGNPQLCGSRFKNDTNDCQPDFGDYVLDFCYDQSCPSIDCSGFAVSVSMLDSGSIRPGDIVVDDDLSSELANNDIIKYGGTCYSVLTVVDCASYSPTTMGTFDTGFPDCPTCDLCWLLRPCDATLQNGDSYPTDLRIKDWPSDATIKLCNTTHSSSPSSPWNGVYNNLFGDPPPDGTYPGKFHSSDYDIWAESVGHIKDTVVDWYDPIAADSDSPYPTRLDYDSSTESWTLRIGQRYAAASSIGCLVWEGTKPGNDPRGVYTRTGGSETKETYVIELNDTSGGGQLTDIIVKDDLRDADSNGSIIQYGGNCYEIIETVTCSESITMGSYSEYASCTACDNALPAEPCPAGCTSCRNDYTVTISDVFGSYCSPSGVDCTDFNGVWTVTKVGTCLWRDATGTIDLECSGSYWYVRDTAGNNCIEFRRKNTYDCPSVLGEYEITGTSGCFQSVSGSVTVD